MAVGFYRVIIDCDVRLIDWKGSQNTNPNQLLVGTAILVYQVFVFSVCVGQYGESTTLYKEREKHVREELVPCRTRNITNEPLVNRDRALFPPLHIKLGLTKQFTKALDKDSDCFRYLCQASPGLKIEKLKAGIFDCPQVHQLIRNRQFKNSMIKMELET
eukprot:gene6047-11422_t